MPANTAHNAYAVWLYNSPTSHQLRRVRPEPRRQGREARDRGQAPRGRRRLSPPADHARDAVKSRPAPVRSCSRARSASTPDSGPGQARDVRTAPRARSARTPRVLPRAGAEAAAGAERAAQLLVLLERDQAAIVALGRERDRRGPGAQQALERRARQAPGSRPGAGAGRTRRPRKSSRTGLPRLRRDHLGEALARGRPRRAPRPATSAAGGAGRRRPPRPPRAWPRSAGCGWFLPSRALSAT